MTTAPTLPRNHVAPAAGEIPPAPTVERLEEVETEAYLDCYRAISEPIKAAAGLTAARVETAIATAATRHDVLAFNRAMPATGQGWIDRETLAPLRAHYRGLGVPRCFLPWPPGSGGGLDREALARQGFRWHNRWVKLVRNAAPEPAAAGAHRPRPLGSAERAAFTGVLARSFALPADLMALFAAAIGLPGWHHLAIDAGGEVAAVAGLRIAGDAAWLGPAATLPGHRGQGAQTALVAARIEIARAAGCRLLVVETAEPLPGRPVASFRNLRRMGFRVAYRRDNFVAELRSGAA